MTDSMIDAKSMTREADGISHLLASGKYSAEEMITIWAGNFRRVERELREEINLLEEEVYCLKNDLFEEDIEARAYRHLRDTANKEEIEYIFLQNIMPEEIDRRMRAALRDIYPDPGFHNPG